MTVIKITRKYHDNCTTGDAFLTNNGKNLRFKTLELPWKDNTRRVSCIKEGVYAFVKHNSPKFGECLWLQDVPNRSEILIHPGNYTRDVLGCILPGEKHTDIDGDGIIDVTNSRKTMKKILELCDNGGLVYVF